MVHVLSSPAETRTQSRILSYVREEGPLSRMDLAGRPIAQNKGLADLVQVAVPQRIMLNAPVVTKDNVVEHIDLGFESCQR